MSNEVSNKTANLPANVMAMATALAASATQAGASSGSDLYMKFTKFGEWVFGVEDTEVEEGSIWAVNPHGLMHGFTAWGAEEFGTKGQNVGEVLVPATQPMPSAGQLPDVKGTWSKAVAVQMRCTNGEDNGLQVIWKANSLGARKAYAAILQEIVARITAGESACVPMVALKKDSYAHKEYGKIFTPEVQVVGWATMDGETAAPETPAAASVTAPAVEEAPPRRRRRAV